MIKLFVTGDVHIGKKYDRYPEIKEKLIESRFECLRRCVKEAEREQCDFLVITGDLFDSINAVKQHDVRDVVQILSKFGGRVLVLPGNHDYYTGEEKVWKDFKNELTKADNNIILITEYEELTLDVGEESVTFYPAFCNSKHSEENRLGWIKKREPDDSDYHVGLAHGSIDGLSPDRKNEYFLMTEKELTGIPMDAWLIGHTHIPYPDVLRRQEEVTGYKVFNAGTPEQTDLSNNTPGLCFVLSLERTDGRTVVSAHSYLSGNIRFFDIPLHVGETGLKAAIDKAVRDLPGNAVIRLTAEGSVPEEEYNSRSGIYEETLGRFLTFEVEDADLCEQITEEKIRSEFAEIGFAAELLEALTDPKELQMAYELIRKNQA